MFPLLYACNDPTVDSGPLERSTLSIVINEILASNSSVLADEAGEFDDWIEIHNTGTDAASLAGVYLSDDPKSPTEWALPSDLSIPPGGFLVVWCDDGAAKDGPLHATFKLDADGDTIHLWPEGADEPLDWIEFGAQPTDISIARVPDGSMNWRATAATPGETNGS
jgi:hypothetical protein